MAILYIEDKDQDAMLPLHVQELESPDDSTRWFDFTYGQTSQRAIVPAQALLEVDEQRYVLKGPLGPHLQRSKPSDTEAQSESAPELLVLEERVLLEKIWADRTKVQIKRGVETERVQVKDQTHAEYLVTQTRPIGRVLEEDETPETRVLEDGTLVIPVIEEKVVLVKQRILKEEFIVSKELTSTPFTEEVELRRTTIHATREALDHP